MEKKQVDNPCGTMKEENQTVFLIMEAGMAPSIRDSIVEVKR